jgi:hypothetical protein
MLLRIAELGDTPLSLTTSEFAKLIVDETEKWGKVIRRPTSGQSDFRADGISGGTSRPGIDSHRIRANSRSDAHLRTKSD